MSLPGSPHCVIEYDPSRVDVEWGSGCGPASACGLATLQHRLLKGPAFRHHADFMPINNQLSMRLKNTLRNKKH